MATTSDEAAFENPKALRSNLKRMKRAQRTVSRRVKGSNNRHKAVGRLVRIHYRVSYIRKDRLHRATREITAKTKLDNHRPGAIVGETKFARRFELGVSLTYLAKVDFDLFETLPR